MAMLDLSQLAGLTLAPNGMLSLPPSQGFEPQGAPQAQPQSAALPPWLQDQMSAPTDLGASFGALSPAPPQAPQMAPPKLGGASLDEMAYGRMSPAATAPADPAALPPNAMPTMGTLPMATAPAPSAPSPRILDRLSAASHNFGNRPGLPGLFDAISGATTGQRVDPAGQQLQSQNATVRALVSKGVAPELAEAAKTNPEILKALMPAFGPRAYQFQTTPDGAIVRVDPSGHENPKEVYRTPNKPTWGVIHENEFGGKEYGWIDPFARVKEVHDAQQGAPGAPAQPGAPSAGITANPMGSQSVYAKGVKETDHSLVGEDYLKQFSPEVQSAVRNYIDGKSMPTGNARKGYVEFIKRTAQKYGEDIGTPADDAAFAGRRKMRTDIASSGNSSMGGILSNGKSAFGHLAELSDAFANLGNRSGPDFPGGSWPGRAANLVGNVMLPTPETSGKITAVRDNALRYGEEATKFYAGSGGGAEERLLALKEHAGATTLATEQAAFLDQEKKLMLGRLREKEAQIRETLGEDYLKSHPVVTPELQRTVEKIDANITKLRGAAPAAAGPGAPAAPAAQAAPLAAAPPKVTRFEDALRLPKGTPFIDPDGVPRIR